jgi:hypothetical protein
MVAALAPVAGIVLRLAIAAMVVTHRVVRAGVIGHLPRGWASSARALATPIRGPPLFAGIGAVKIIDRRIVESVGYRHRVGAVNR